MARARQTDPKREPEASAIYRTILDNMTGGVISLDPHGVITTFNAAASATIGLPAEAVVGRTFAEVFLEMEGVDEFTELVLDALYDASVGHQRLVEATFAGRKRSLSVATAYLQETRAGESAGIGLVAVFSDISEIKELREKEFRLAKEVEAKHGELRAAYVRLEEKNRTLNTALRQAQAARIGAAGMVVVLFVALGVFTWNAAPQLADTASPVGISSSGLETLPTVVIKPRHLVATIAVPGHLAAQREIDVTSPITGKVATVHFQYGDQVVEGQQLVDLDVTTVQIEHREARAAYIKARERFKEFEDWSHHVEVSRARRAVSKARLELESRKSRFEETAFLLERGVIPASEHEAAERGYRNQELDVQSAEQDLQIILAKGLSDGQVARLELENTRARVAELEETLRKAAVYAPVAGVILYPQRNDNGIQGREEERRLVGGTSVQQGELLLTIGDLNGVSVVGTVDEVDIPQVRPGDPARIVGEAFPGIELHGTIAHVSSQASSSGTEHRLPSFAVTAVVEELTAAQRQLLRLGMSANMEVVVDDKPDALLVPIEAVSLDDGQPRLWVKDEQSGAVQSVEVVTGVTTVDAVEIVAGIEAGAEIVLSGR